VLSGSFAARRNERRGPASNAALSGGPGPANPGSVVQAHVAARTDGSEVGEHIRTAVRDRDDVIDRSGDPPAELAALPITVKDPCSHFPPRPRGRVAGLVVGQQEPSLTVPQERQGFTRGYPPLEPSPSPIQPRSRSGWVSLPAPVDPADNFQALRLMFEPVDATANATMASMFLPADRDGRSSRHPRRDCLATAWLAWLGERLVVTYQTRLDDRSVRALPFAA
jgi:hypothetical protein